MSSASLITGLIPILVIGIFFTGIYILSYRSSLLRAGKSRERAQPYTSGVLLNTNQFTHVSDMIVFLSMLLAIESLIIVIFLAGASLWLMALFSASLLVVVLGYLIWIEGGF
ncbi:MAG: hypothetical protein QXQ36_06870 [Sulfolobales archaeon]